MDKLELEKNFLEIVKDRIIAERKEQLETLERIPHEYKGRYAQVKWGDEDLVNNLTKMYANRIEKLKNLENNPYFGSFTFALNSKNEKTFRLGKTDLSDNTSQLVLDWRNPICTLYYDQSIGEVSYEAPAGIIKGNLTNKSQILIKDGEIESIYDVDLVSDDVLLKPYLEVNADSRMKTIIASIQAEQNKIIRENINKNLIIQGVAGSGKTSVALHRIAYLIYNNGDKNLDASNFAIIGPNKYFLNYISSVLPDLDTKSAKEFTFEELSQSIINEPSFHIENSNEELSKNNLNSNAIMKKVKGTLQYKKCLEMFIRDYFSSFLNESIKYENIVLIDKEYLKKGINFKKGYYESINDFIKISSKRIKDNFEDTYYDLVRPLMDEMKKYPLRSPERNSVIARMDVLKEMLKKGCNKELKALVKPLLISPVNLYKTFLENLDKYIELSEEEYDVLITQSMKLLKKKVIPYEDLAAIDYISLMYYGTTEYEKYRHCVIDEAQDYNLFQFDIIKTLFNKGTFSIFGDLAQSIYSYRSISDWEEVKKQIFEDRCDILRLLKSYRNTKEITCFSNKVLKSLDLTEAHPVIRDGEQVHILKRKDEELFLSLIREYEKEGYKSVGVICKNESEMNKIKIIFDKLNIKYNYVTNLDSNYNGGTSLLTSYLAKGLEFDVVVITDASQTVYDTLSKNDMHLLYVAMTRALHRLDILYSSNITQVLSEEDLKDTNKLSKKM